MIKVRVNEAAPLYPKARVFGETVTLVICIRRCVTLDFGLRAWGHFMTLIKNIFALKKIMQVMTDDFMNVHSKISSLIISLPSLPFIDFTLSNISY